MDLYRRLLLLALIAPVSVEAGRCQQQPTDPVLQQALREVRAIRDADAIVTARVRTVHPSPGIWCGILVTHQEVTYVVDGCHAGVAVKVGSEIRVGHLLVANSPLVAQHAPFLRPDRVYVGARALLCLTRDDDGDYVVLDESYGARLLDAPRTADARLTAVLQQVVSLPALQPFLHLDRPGRRPVRMLLDEVVTAPVVIVAGGQAVEFLPRELMRGHAYLQIDAITFEGDQAQVKFSLPAEGVLGTAACVRRDGSWVARRDSVIAER